MPDLHFDLVAAAIAIVMWIAWSVRLEFVAAQNKKEVEMLWVKHENLEDEMRKRHDELSSELRKEISEMNKALARIEGKLSVEQKHNL